MHNKNYSELAEKLKSNFPKSKVECDEPMARHTTFRIGGPADIYIEPDTSEVVGLINCLRAEEIPYIVLGNGSNILVSDDGIEGVVVAFGKSAAEISIEGTEIIAQAGAMLSTVANTAAREELTGLEFAAGIPGSIGGAVFMNAGAYGGEIKDVLVSVSVLMDNGQVAEIPAEELDLSYRHSRLMENGGIILSARLKLSKGEESVIKSTMNELKNKRVEKQPLNYPSAGSTFKRPEGYFAGKLIDDAGLRGYTVGDAMVSEKHCGFVVNKGNASCADVLKLMKDVDEKVFESFGVHLEPEVRIIGRGN